MPKIKPSAPARDEIEQDFLKAIQRLQAGEPANKALKIRKNRGSLKFNVSSVALEAGRSRTLIATEKNCRYPRVRELIRQFKAGRTSPPTTNSKLIAELRLQKAELTMQVKKYKAEAMLHFQARLKAEEEASRERAAASRLRKSLSMHGKVREIRNT